MASIKLKFRPSSIKGKKGVLSYQIIHYRLTRLIKTSYRIMPSEWDDSTGSLLISTQSECKARLLLIRDQTNWEMTRLQGIINDLERTGVEYTIDDIVASFRKIPSVESVFNFMQRCINKLERQKRGRTAEGYTSTMNSFIQFRKNEDLSFEAFDSELMEMYEAYLKEKGLVKNSTSYYMRIWRSVYNLAVEQGYTTDKKPFKHVYTGIDKTVKRAVPFKIIKMIKELDLSFEPQLELARDIFLFSFYTRGMSFIDMAHLKKSNLQNGILTYSRKKTGQRLTILWEELMQEIVDKYKDDTSEYLLPILRYCDINDRKQYKLRAKQIGRGLNKIGLRLELKAPLTFYVARHSWASIAQDRKVSTDIIREGLGHDNEKTSGASSWASSLPSRSPRPSTTTPPRPSRTLRPRRSSSSIALIASSFYGRVGLWLKGSRIRWDTGPLLFG